MTVLELIANLQTLDQDAEVLFCIPNGEYVEIAGAEEIEEGYVAVLPTLEAIEAAEAAS